MHLETALSQFAGTEHLIGTELDRALAGAPDEQVPGDLAAGRAAALDAIADHRRWLEQRLADGAQDAGAPNGGSPGDGFRDPRIGPELFARKLQLTLESSGSPGNSWPGLRLTWTRRPGRSPRRRPAWGCGRDDSHPDGAGGGHGGLVRQVLDSLAADAPDDATILGLVRRAYDTQLAFVREHAIVTAYDDPVDVIEMLEIDRGVAMAYCDPPGPLETAEMPNLRGGVAGSRGLDR